MVFDYFITVYDFSSAAAVFVETGYEGGYEAGGCGTERLTFLPAVFRHEAGCEVFLAGEGGAGSVGGGLGWGLGSIIHDWFRGYCCGIVNWFGDKGRLYSRGGGVCCWRIIE